MTAALPAAQASPEVRFITLCTLAPELVTSDALLAAAGAVRSWDNVAQIAVRHRVFGYVLRSVSRANLNLPLQARAELESESIAAQALVLLLKAQLRKIVAAFASVGIPVLVLKGPCLEEMLYAESGLRPYADLDLTIRRERAAEAVALLEQLGYTELTYEAEQAQSAHVGHLHEAATYHRIFAGAGDRALVELHLDSLQLGIGPACEADRWARAEPLPGYPGAWMLGLEDQVVQLCVHLHKHGFSRLIWLKDIDLLIRCHGAAVNWALVADIARREGVVASVWYTLELTRRLLGTTLPQATAVFRPPLVTRWLYEVVWPMARVGNLEGFLRRRAVQFHADSWRGRLPSLVLMGRKSLRARLLIATVLRN